MYTEGEEVKMGGEEGVKAHNLIGGREKNRPKQKSKGKADDRNKKQRANRRNRNNKSPLGTDKEAK